MRPIVTAPQPGREDPAYEIPFVPDWDDDAEYTDDEDDELAGFEDCGMMRDGMCRLAGTEWCDWDCPRNRPTRNLPSDGATGRRNPPPSAADSVRDCLSAESSSLGGQVSLRQRLRSALLPTGGRNPGWRQSRVEARCSPGALRRSPSGGRTPASFIYGWGGPAHADPADLGGPLRAALSLLAHRSDAPAGFLAPRSGEDANRLGTPCRAQPIGEGA